MSSLMKNCVMLFAVVGVVGFSADQAEARGCGGDTLAGAIVGGIIGAIIGDGLGDAGLGAAIGAGSGALIANESCEAQRAFSGVVYARPGSYREWRDGHQHGYFEVDSWGEYRTRERTYTECREITSYHSYGRRGHRHYGHRNRGWGGYDVVETRLYCRTRTKKVRVFERYNSSRYYRY